MLLADNCGTFAPNKDLTISRSILLPSLLFLPLLAWSYSNSKIRYCAETSNALKLLKHQALIGIGSPKDLYFVWCTVCPAQVSAVATNIIWCSYEVEYPAACICPPPENAMLISDFPRKSRYRSSTHDARSITGSRSASRWFDTRLWAPDRRFEHY